MLRRIHLESEAARCLEAQAGGAHFGAGNRIPDVLIVLVVLVEERERHVGQQAAHRLLHHRPTLLVRDERYRLQHLRRHRRCCCRRVVGQQHGEKCRDRRECSEEIHVSVL